jgi:hypothetical protein
MCHSTHEAAKLRKRNRCLLQFFCLLPFCLGARAQESQTISEIPIERCDLLPIVKVRIDGTDMRFLLDTAATSMLNLKSFSSGRSKEIQVTSWSGTSLPGRGKEGFPAREISAILGHECGSGPCSFQRDQ